MTITVTKIFMRNLRFLACRTVFLMAMCCLASSIASTNCNAAASLPIDSRALEMNCAQMVTDTMNRDLGKDAISTVQQQLVLLKYSPEWVDGKFGQMTASALKEFCENAKYALAQDLLVMLQNHVAIFKEYPHWKETLASADFGKWASGEYDSSGIDGIRNSGNAPEVIALLDRYQKRKISNPVAPLTDDFQVSYALSKENFNQLKTSGEVFKQLEKLQGKNFASRQDFETAIKPALKGAADPEMYMQLVWKCTEPQVSRKLSQESFNKLKVQKVPAYILQALQELKDLDYPQNEIAGAVKTAINDIADKVSQSNLAEIAKLAEVSGSGTVTFTDDSVEKYSEAHKDDPGAALILAKLQKLKNVEYQSSKTMTAAVKNLLKQVAAEINRFQGVVLDSAQESMVYGLTGVSMSKIDQQKNRFTMPEIYMEMLADLQDVDYPEQDLFLQAAEALISRAAPDKVFRATIFGLLEEQAADTVDDALLEQLRARSLPPALITLLASLQGRKFDDTKALENEIDHMLDKLVDEYKQYRPLLVSLAQKKHPFDKTKIIHWSGESCNCVHDNLSGQVYGFYPYWMAGEKQRIDFSVQTRFGYFALDFDDKGEIADSSRWSELNTDFIREARTYGSKVDLVIHRGNWDSWKQLSAAEKSAAFKKLAAGIAGLLDIPLSNFYSKAIPVVSLGLNRQPVMGDGVTLYLEKYPDDAESVEAFAAFIRGLRDNLQAQGRQYSVNIMFRSSEIGRGIYDYHKLLETMDAIKTENLSSLYLALLPEPTTDSKKLLRSNIEDELHGEERIKLLRNIVTVLAFDGRNMSQLNDDVIYAKDNYGGIGFWPQPLAASGIEESPVSAALHGKYMNVAAEDAPSVCRYICPNKWAFRVAWGFFIFALLISVAMRFLSCTWRALFDQNFIYLIAGIVIPTFLLTLALLFCDPGWASISRGNGILIFVILAVIAYSIWNYQDKKSKADLP